MANFLASLLDDPNMMMLAGTTALGGMLSMYLYNKYIKIPKVDMESQQNGGELVAQVLKAHGVKWVFTLIGGHISPILVESEKRDIRVIDVRHEVNTVFAADAVARLTGVPGVAAVTAGPGLTNTVTAVKNAQMAESPVVLLGGAAATLLKGRGALQDIEQLALFKPICKWTATVKRVRDIPDILRKAFKICQEGTPGPVFVEFPIDTLYPFDVVFKEAGANPKPTDGFVKKIINWYIERSIKTSFHNAFRDGIDFSPLPYTYPKHTTTQIARAVSLLKKAKRPMIILGSQATLPPVKPHDLQQALEKMGIPCFLGGMCRGLLGRNSSIQITQKRSVALKEADVVVLVGSVADFRLGYGRSFSRRSKVIAINRNYAQLHKNAGIFWNATLAIQADAASFIVDLQRHLSASGFKVDQSWMKQLRDRAHKREEEIRAKAEVKTNYVNPLKLLQIVDDVLDDDCIMVADGGDFIGSAAYVLKPRGPLCWMDPGAFGTLGVGAGFAIGAKLVHPDKQVVILYGDGSLGYSIIEYDTYNRHNIPIMSIIGNDACWTQIARDQIPRFKSDVACNLKYSQYEQVVKAFGGEGFLIKDIKDARKILQDGAKACANGNASLVNVFIGTTDFREGSISV